MAPSMVFNSESACTGGSERGDSAGELHRFTTEMHVKTCQSCQHLIEKVSVSSTQHLGVRLLLDTAVKNNPGDRNIPSLRRLESSLSLDRREAVDQYRIHMLSHEMSSLWAALAA